MNTVMKAATNPLEELSDAGDSLAAALAGLTNWAQANGLDCKDERKVINRWCRVNEETLANATHRLSHPG